ncbi:MAG TPA: YeeE/YedE thiosulfate transporter family protein [Anaerohalosphaeraceae bacterium]|nr:YeeE/YedE thiosulfate transporter family protein [Anaerohalosphaeraceae bacterium]
MGEIKVPKAPLPWWAAGLALGLIQVLAVYVKGPLGVSTQFVILDSIVMHKAAPEYAQNHPLLSQEKNRKIGYGFWLDVGIVLGAFTAAVMVKRWKLQTSTVWWKTNRNGSLFGRFFAGFIGGIFILLGARLAHGCTSGGFASGWAQLSLNAVPMTIGLFSFGMLTAWLVYPKTPDFEK